MRYALIPLVLASACLPQPGGAVAVPDAPTCAWRAASALGYQLTSSAEQASSGSFVAEKPLPREGFHPVVGVLTVSIWGDAEGAMRMQVQGARYEESVGSVPRAGARPGVQPGPGGQPPSTTTLGNRRSGRRRLTPGPVAQDAQVLRSRCTSAGSVAVR